MSVKSLVADIEEVDDVFEGTPELGNDVIMWAIPMPTYKAISDAAARKNMTVAELVSRALAIAIEEG